MGYARKISCIYKITSITTGRIYIGSAINYDRRKYMHLWFLKKNRHHSIFLQNNFNKYGIDDLIFEIIELTPIENLIDREQFYIDKLNPDFNISKKAYSTLGVKCSEEKKEKLRKIHTGRKATPEAIISNRLGQLKRLPPSEETRLKLSLINKGRVVSEESKIKNALNQKRKPVFCITNQTEYLSVRDCAKKLNIRKELISRVCRGLAKQSHGLTFKYLQQ